MAGPLRWLMCLLAVLTVASSAAGAATDTEADVARAERRGALIYAYDQAAWYSTDAIMPLIDKRGLQSVRGWVVEPQGEALKVTYYALDGQEPRAVVDAVMAGARVISTHVFGANDDHRLSPLGRRLARARAIAMARPERPCSNAPFNVVMLPPETPGGPVPVYLLTAQTDARLFPAGGHFEVDVGADESVMSSRKFMTACFNVPRQEGAKLFTITHLLDPQPTEIHIFLSLWMHMPIVVATMDGKLWLVEKGRVERTPETIPVPSAPAATR